jgi:uncharacterized RDD family membrane protein YckC
MVMTDVAGGPVYAGFWRRFWALVIDTIIMGLVLAAVAVPVLLWSGISLESDLTDVSEWGDRAGAIAYAADFVLWWLYFSIMESSPLQATLGKMVLSIRVTDTAGQRISFLRATGRTLAKIISGAILLIGYIMAAFTERKQALHDIIAQCLVVRGRA